MKLLITKRIQVEWTCPRCQASMGIVIEPIKEPETVFKLDWALPEGMNPNVVSTIQHACGHVEPLYKILLWQLGAVVVEGEVAK